MHLDELLQTENLDHFGQKIAQLVQLCRVFPHIDTPLHLDIPDFFGVPIDKSVESAFEDYANITAGKDRCIVFARSSDLEESPGKFESHPSLFRKSEVNESFGRWLEAARKVRQSGARGVLGQLAVIPPFDFKQFREDPSGEPCFLGEHTGTGFVGQSVNVFGGANPLVVAAWGLPSKIVRGDTDVHMTDPTGESTHVVLDNNYTHTSLLQGVQRSFDTITLDAPDRISTINKELRWRTAWEDMRPYGEDFDSWEITELLQQLRTSLGHEVEVEGMIMYNPTRVHLVQVREYTLPSSHIINLTAIPEEQLLVPKDPRLSLGSYRFSGDVYASPCLIDVPEGAIFAYTNQDLYQMNVRQLEAFTKHHQILIPMFNAPDKYRAAAHEFGATVQTLVRLEKLGVHAIAIPELWWKIRQAWRKQNNSKGVPEGVEILRDITVECDGEHSQWYANLPV